MLTLKDYAWEGSGRNSFTFESHCSHKNQIVINGARLHAIYHHAIEENTVFLSWYIPTSTNTLNTYLNALHITNEVVKETTKAGSITMSAGAFGSFKLTQEPIFSGRVFIYGDEDMTELEEQQFQEYGKSLNLSPVFRGKKYIEERIKIPHAFISHSSLDKDLIARPIADGLLAKGCRVWYDEYSLKVGDRLRQSIEKGLKECKTCILILTPNFLKNNGWGLTEYDAIFNREINTKEDLLLPVWSNVTSDQVSEYSLSLSNRIGLKLENIGLPAAIDKLYSAIEDRKHKPSSPRI